MNTIYRPLIGALIVVGAFTAPYQAQALPKLKCDSLLEQKADLAKSWAQAQDSIAQIRSKIYGQQDAIKAQLRAAIAKDFVFFTGGPGAAKTLIARTTFKAMLNSIPESDKQTFLLQFHKFINEGKITGTQKIKSLLEDGKYEIETSTSLVGDRYLFLIADEAEKANPATLNALLSVMNERAAFHGSKVVHAILSSGVFTSNKSAAQFLDGFKEDRPSGEALLDRMGQKVYVLNQQLNADNRTRLYNSVAEARKHDGQTDLEPLPVFALMDLADQIEIPDGLLRDMEKLTLGVDSMITTRVNSSRIEVSDSGNPRTSELFPSNQFSNRSSLRDLRIFKASKIVDALWSGVPYDQIDFTVDRNDLYLLANSYITAGLGGIAPKEYDVSDFGRQLDDSKNGWPTSFHMRVKKRDNKVIRRTAVYSPYKDTVRLGGQRELSVPVIRNKKGKITGFGEFGNASSVHFIMKDAEADLIAMLNKFDEDNSIDVKQPIYEASEVMDRALSLGTLRQKHKQQILDIKQEATIFTSELNDLFGTKADNSAIEYDKSLVSQALTREYMRGDPEKIDQSKQAYNLVQASYESLNSRYLESSHTIEAMMTSLVMNEHVYLFGPPGGAKTMLSNELLRGVVRGLKREQAADILQYVLKRAESDDEKYVSFVRGVLEEIHRKDKKSYDIFVLQFHKFLPEGALIGFPKLQQQMDTGVEEIELSTSLAAEKFVFAILDEADKANPQTLMALLSILNERQVFHGSRVFQTALRMAVVTSNKMPGELLDSFLDDRESAEAFTDRLFFKVFANNKLAEDGSLLNLMKRALMGDLDQDKNLMLPMEQIKNLADKVQINGPIIHEVATKIMDDFLARRIAESESTETDHEDGPMEFPDYYIPAQEGSDRSYIKYIDFIGPRFIIHQLTNGVAYEDLRYEFTMADLHILFEGLSYWVPMKFNVEEDNSTDAKGVYVYSADTSKIEGLLRSNRLLRRSEYFLDKSVDEVKDFLDVTNSIVRDYVTKHQDYVSQFPGLFPELQIKKEDKK